MIWAVCTGTQGKTHRFSEMELDNGKGGGHVLGNLSNVGFVKEKVQMAKWVLCMNGPNVKGSKRMWAMIWAMIQ